MGQLGRFLRALPLFLSLALAIASVLSIMTDTHTTPHPTAGVAAPSPRKQPVSITSHGFERVDEYAWMRADNWREVMQNPGALPEEIRAHLEAENAYAEGWMADTKALQELLFCEMRGRIKEEDEGVPTPDGPYAYYGRTRQWNPETGEGQYGVSVRKRWDAETQMAVGEEEVLFDGDLEAKGSEYFDLGGLSHSPDHTLLAYATDTSGSERYEIRVRRIADGVELDDVIADTAGDFVWANDNKTLFWVARDENNRPAKVYRHVLGQSGADDLVYEEPDPGFFVGVGKTETDDFIVISAGNHTTSEYHLIDAHVPDSAPQLVAAREDGVEYGIHQQGDRLLITTNADGAVDFKLMTTPLNAMGRENWVELVPHRPGILLLGVRTFSGHVVRLERENALDRIVVHRLSDGEEHTLALDEEAYALGLSGQYEYDTSELRYGYSSPTTPGQVFRYDMNTRTRELLKAGEVPSGHEPSDYVARRIAAKGHDGAEIPVTVLHHKSTPLDGSAPALLYGYGSYGITIPPGFSTGRLSLVDRGMVFAIAHIRGGMAKGYQWYLDGKREKKINTFKDFISAGEALIEHGFTGRGNIVAMGGSAGGLLVGASLNMAPDLFGGAVALVPFVDVLNTMSDGDLPLTPPEWPEWGNPLESADDYQIMAEYSPYDRVAHTPYPPVLITGGLTDPRVTYWEPAKWAARLRDRSTSDAPVLCKINLDAGHGGASGRFDALKETTFEFAFTLKAVGLADSVAQPACQAAATLGKARAAG